MLNCIKQSKKHKGVEYCDSFQDWILKLKGYYNERHREFRQRRITIKTFKFK